MHYSFIFMFSWSDIRPYKTWCSSSFRLIRSHPGVIVKYWYSKGRHYHVSRAEDGVEGEITRGLDSGSLGRVSSDVNSIRVCVHEVGFVRPLHVLNPPVSACKWRESLLYLPVVYSKISVYWPVAQITTQLIWKLITADCILKEEYELGIHNKNYMNSSQLQEFSVPCGVNMNTLLTHHSDICV